MLKKLKKLKILQAAKQRKNLVASSCIELTILSMAIAII